MSSLPCHSEPSRAKNLQFYLCFLLLLLLLLLLFTSCTTPFTPPPNALSIAIPSRWSQDLNAQATPWLAAQLRVYEMPSQTKVHDTTMEVDETTGTVKAKSFKLPGGKTYKFIIEFQYLTPGQPIAFAYAEVEKEIGDGNAETVSFTSSDIRYEVDKQDPNISASISQGIIPDLDPDNDGWSSYQELKDKVSPTDKTSIPQPPALKISTDQPQQGPDLFITLEGEDNAHVEEMKLSDPICGVTKISEVSTNTNGKVTQKTVYRLDLLSVSSQLNSRSIQGTISDGVTSVQGQSKEAELQKINSTQSHPSFAFSDPELGTELEGMATLKGVACARYGVENISLKYNGEALIGYTKEETKNVLLREIEISFRQVNTEALPDGVVNLEVEVMDENKHAGVGNGQYKVTNSNPIKIESPKGRKWVFGNEPISFNVVNQPNTTLVLAAVSLEKSDEDINEDLLMVPLSPVSTNSNSATYTLDVSHAEEGGTVKILVSASQSDGSIPPTRTIKFKVRNKPKIKTYQAGELWKGWEGGKISYEIENVEKNTITIEGQAKPSLNCAADPVNGIMSCKGELPITPQQNQMYLLKASRNSTAKEVCEEQCNADRSITPEVTILGPDMPKYGVISNFPGETRPKHELTLPENNKEYRVRAIELNNNGQETAMIPIDEKKSGGTNLPLSNLKPRKDYKFKVEETSGAQILNTLEKIVTTGDQGLVLWLRFNEDPSKNIMCDGADDPAEIICDYSGENNHGIPFGGPTWLEGQGAMSFDGVDDYINIQSAPSLNFNNGESIGMDVRLTVMALDDGAFVVTKGSWDGSHGNYSFMMNPSTNEFGFTLSNPAVTQDLRVYPNYLVSTGFPILNNASHIILTHKFGDANSTKMSINGVPSPGSWTYGTGNVQPDVQDLPLTLGKRTQPSPFNIYYEGLVDELIIYRTHLGDDYMTGTSSD
ncbi:MAG: hypothetical protein HYU97_12015 [Deltaproteobacteria bacterium]|nr:hypothetical protein [Deltaproteobacteria bacterium]